MLRVTYTRLTCSKGKKTKTQKKIKNKNKKIPRSLFRVDAGGEKEEGRDAVRAREWLCPYYPE